MINIGISMISILMIYIYQKFWLNAGWISTWVENDLGGFCLGGKWLQFRVDFGGVGKGISLGSFDVLFSRFKSVVTFSD